MRNAFLFCLVGLFWGASFIAIKYVIAAVPPVTGAAARVGVALLTLYVIFTAGGKTLTVPANVRRALWLTGFFGLALPFSLLFWGEQWISAGVAGMLNGTVPIWTFGLGLVFLREYEKFSFRKLAGILLGLAGLFLIFAPSLNGFELWGSLAVTGMALSYAISTLMAKRLLSGKAKVSVPASVFHQHTGAFVCLLVMTFAVDGFRLPHFTGAALAGTIYLGVFSTALGFIVFNFLIREWGATRAAAITYIVPLAAVCFDWLCFGNLPAATALFGSLLVLSGVFLIRR